MDWQNPVLVAGVANLSATARGNGKPILGWTGLGQLVKNPYRINDRPLTESLLPLSKFQTRSIPILELPLNFSRYFLDFTLRYM